MRVYFLQFRMYVFVSERRNIALFGNEAVNIWSGCR